MPIVRAVIFCVGKKKLTVDLTDLVSGLIKVNRPNKKSIIYQIGKGYAITMLTGRQKPVYEGINCEPYQWLLILPV